MKLYLSSLAPSPDQAIVLAKLAGKDIQSVQIGLIENAADVYAESDRAWVTENRETLQKHGFNIERIDVRKFRDNLEGLRAKLSAKDVVWFGGGNTYYLRWILRDMSAENIIRDLVMGGLVYAGGSAGAIVAGPTLMYFESADDPSESPGVIFEGLNLTDKVIVPHFDNQKFSETAHSINDKLLASGYSTIPLRDSQAFVVDGASESIV
jgi:dipeptidase E